MATHTDYKLHGIHESADGVSVTVRFYVGEYRDVNVDPDNAGAGTESRYTRTTLAGVRRFTFSTADYTRRKLTNYLDDALDRLNAHTNIPEQTRKVNPSLSPSRAEVLA